MSYNPYGGKFTGLQVHLDCALLTLRIAAPFGRPPGFGGFPGQNGTAPGMGPPPGMGKDFS